MGMGRTGWTVYTGREKIIAHFFITKEILKFLTCISMNADLPILIAKIDIMHKIYTATFILTFFISCTDADKQENTHTVNKNEFTIYAPVIKDSFNISVQLPEAYNKDSTPSFPVVYITDANFHFPMLAATLKQYERGGLLPPVILVGIGYKSFELMDSLRVRDYMYPAALPSDEMNAAGGGKNFVTFITEQLIPYIDSNYRTNKSDRCLAGHSFGGYFSLYALLNQVENKRSDFNNFIAASPSLWYHDFYLDRLSAQLKTMPANDTLHIFLSVGGSEDSTWSIEPVKKLAKSIEQGSFKNIQMDYKIYNNLGHMDVAQLSFIKGLQQFYKMQQ